ncbi:MAG: hypothetical protein CMN16_10215 [Roseovarius sp.]|nr:hypothetical protein [Roseovarius sp.]
MNGTPDGQSSKDPSHRPTPTPTLTPPTRTPPPTPTLTPCVPTPTFTPAVGRTGSPSTPQPVSTVRLRRAKAMRRIIPTAPSTAPPARAPARAPCRHS